MEAVGARLVAPASARRGAALRRVHAVSACVVGTFAVLHLANHLAALGGVEAHIAFMRAARHVYRQRAVEVLLLACVALQVGTGLSMVFGRAWPRSALLRVQSVAGIAIAAFLLVHVGAVLAARTLLGLDTTFHFAAAGLHAGGWAWFFAPYYFGAVTALFVHLGCAAQRRFGAGSKLPILIGAVIGVALALIIVLCLAGVLIDVKSRWRTARPLAAECRM